jgi:hypothetical protein
MINLGIQISFAMKLTTLIATIGSVTATAFAGEPAPVQTAAAPAPALGGWFAGAGFGQFESELSVGEGANLVERTKDIDFDMYSLHVGRDLGTQFLGCDLATYLEVGYLDGDTNLTIPAPTPPVTTPPTPPGQPTVAGLDVEIIPITLNLLAERTLFSSIKGYISGGIGYAFTETSFLGNSDSDGGFYAQASIGLAYDINEQWEMYGGARYIYLGDLEIGGGPGGAELDDSVGYEIGLRYNF